MLDTESAGAIPPGTLEEAADWLMRLNAQDASAQDHAACERWRQRSPMHARAWERPERLLHTLGQLPPALAMRTLDRPKSEGRRAAARKLAVLLGAGYCGWAAWQGWHWLEGPQGANLLATHRTGTGERLQVPLADGGIVRWVLRQIHWESALARGRFLLNCLRHNPVFKAIGADMKDTALYEHLPGVKTPWSVKAVDLSLQDQRVVVQHRLELILLFWGLGKISQSLALARALSARSYLIARGVSPLKIVVNFASAADFIADNSTPEGRLENQRVEVELVFVGN